jgi:hypothetical protein
MEVTRPCALGGVGGRIGLGLEPGPMGILKINTWINSPIIGSMNFAIDKTNGNGVIIRMPWSQWREVKWVRDSAGIRLVARYDVLGQL